MPRAARNAARKIPGLPSTTFILDNGGYSIKAGFAPFELQSDVQTLHNCHAIPNAIARTTDRRTYIGAQLDSPTIRWSEAAYRRPVEHGQTVSWETEKEIWDMSFFDESTAHLDLCIKEPEHTTLVLTEAPNTMPSLQKNADEIVMEEWGFGGYSRIVGPSLNAYNDLHPLFGDKARNISGLMAAQPVDCLLVIDCGFSHTTVTPVYRGRPIQRAVRRLDFGGKHLTNLLREIISVRHADLHSDVKLVTDIKEDVCYVSQDFVKDIDATWIRNSPGKKPAIIGNDDRMDIDEPAIPPTGLLDYTLPDFRDTMRGNASAHDSTRAATRERKRRLGVQDDSVLTLGNERFAVPEIIFNPSDVSSSQAGLSDVVMQSLAVLPPLIQATMLANTLVVGGTAQLPGFVERLQRELRERVRDEWVVRVRQMTDPVTSAWLGGARRATDREVVRTYGVTREEYLEHGSAWVARRFTNGP